MNLCIPSCDKSCLNSNYFVSWSKRWFSTENAQIEVHSEDVFLNGSFPFEHNNISRLKTLKIMKNLNQIDTNKHLHFFNLDVDKIKFIQIRSIKLENNLVLFTSQRHTALFY